MSLLFYAAPLHSCKYRWLHAPDLNPRVTLRDDRPAVNRTLQSVHVLNTCLSSGFRADSTDREEGKIP